MNKLYPLGTVLTTRRISQAALYVEIFGEENIKSFSSYEDRWHKGFKTHFGGDFVCMWRVTVTPENQAWVSTPQEYTKPDGQRAPLLEWDEED